MAPQLAWIGLGNMGRGMCRNLVEKGELSKPLIIFNRTPKRAEELSAKLPSGKTEVVTELKTAMGRADFVFTCLGDDAAVLETVQAAVKECDVKSKLFVDCSTIHPDTTSTISKLVHENGAYFVACPVFGAPAMAEAGQLICVLAGPTEQADRVKPFLSGVMGRAVIDYSGQEPSRATLLKVIGNTFIFSMIEALSEGHVVAEKSGLGVENLQKFLELLFPGPYVAYSKRMSSGDYYQRKEPLFSVDLARKDAAHAMRIAHEAGARMKGVEMADAHLQKVQKQMGSKGDVAGIYGAVRTENGLKFEN